MMMMIWWWLSESFFWSWSHQPKRHETIISAVAVAWTSAPQSVQNCHWCTWGGHLRDVSNGVIHVLEDSLQNEVAPLGFAHLWGFDNIMPLWKAESRKQLAHRWNPNLTTEVIIVTILLASHCWFFCWHKKNLMCFPPSKGIVTHAGRTVWNRVQRKSTLFESQGSSCILWKLPLRHSCEI